MINIFFQLRSNDFRVEIETKAGMLVKVYRDEKSAIDLALLYKPSLILVHIADEGMINIRPKTGVIYKDDNFWCYREEIPPTRARICASVNFYSCLHEAYSNACNLIYIETRGLYENL